MAETVNWEKLRELAAFRAEKGCAVSVYLDLNPSVSPTAGESQTRVHSLLDEGERADGADSSKLTHEQREALRSDFERIRRFFEDELDRDGAHGAAVFSAGLDGAWTTLMLTESVSDRVAIGSQFHLAPLVPLVGRGTGAIVAVVGREAGELFGLRGGRLHELADLSGEAPRRHDQGGRSQARNQRHVDELAKDHLRTVADELDRQVRRLRSSRVVIVGPEEMRAEFADLISSAVRDVVLGSTQAESHASPTELLEVVSPLLEQAHVDEERETLERWRAEAGRGERASSGWEETLQAASDARVETLLYQDGIDRSVCQCPACGRLSLAVGNCPLDDTPMEQRENGLDLTVHQALAQGGTVLAVQHHQDLDPVEGIGAVLRY